MKKSSRIFSLLCAFCLLFGVTFVSAAGASADASEPAPVHIRSMWNSSFLISNDGGVGRYTASSAGPETVWTVSYQNGYAVIRCWDGACLRAGNGAVTCEAFAEGEPSFLWTVEDAGWGYVRILSVGQPGKAVNIENLTGSLQLTDYYDSWESARWALEGTDAPETPAAPEPSAETDTVIFQGADRSTFLYNGAQKGILSPLQASVSSGNFRYRILRREGYCFLQFAPAAYHYTQYLKTDAVSPELLTSGDLDESDETYRWIIRENPDGTVTLESAAHPGRCITTAGASTLGEIASSGLAGRWTIHSGNSLLVRFSTSTRSLGAGPVGASGSAADETACFGFVTTDADLSVQWQVIYSGTDVYLKNAFNGKYLKAPSAAGDIQLKVTDYNAAEDSLYRWSTARPKYAISLSNGSAYVYVDNSSANPSAPRARYDAFISTTFPYGSSYLQLESTGFAQ